LFDLIIRTISGIIGLPILAVFLIFGGGWLRFGVLFLSLAGLFEFYRAVSKKILPVHIFGFLATILYVSLLGFKIEFEYYQIVTMIFLLLSFSFIVFMHRSININDVCATVVGFFYITAMLGNIYLIRESEYGEYIVWLVFICAFCSDTGAYFTGSAIGKHKLTPVLSPKKTYEGAFGGILFTAIVAGFYGYCMYEIWHIGEENLFLLYAVLGAVGSVFAQIGDLAASSIKRFVGIKDYGKIMPGHGGVLDRFDSVLFTSPLIYIFITVGKEVIF